ncbi:polyamine-transporting ATPase 13A2 isoform X2 [Sceloporus undulatus]|uniref:polyamine-transporting ATPase 13A2 isoform X2 n=1 Tax=Sceloporus undulatus TaxID=8520 RepID=UPI001C4D4C48|nr:polyamine-transporting ATPase 13A2 isoform X2 [Sceloporus undulatus]
MEVSGYQRKAWKVALCRLLSVLTLGLPLLVFHWKPRLELQAKCSRCPLRQANWVLIRDQFGQHFTARVEMEQVEGGGLEHGGGDGRSSVAVGVLGDEEESRETAGLHQKEEEEEEKGVVRYYVFEGLRYIWIEKRQSFCKASLLDESWTCAEIRLSHFGLSAEEQATRRKLYGPNLIDVPVKSYLRLLRDEILNPFYIFQIFSISLWLCDEYYSYATCIFIISTFSIGISLYQTRKQSTTLRNMARMSVSVRIRRGPTEEVTVSSTDLVPGDCIVVPPDGMLFPCDAALLTGECMVNESLLTGESIPLMKTPLPNGPEAPASTTIYCPEEHKRHTLFCGTQVLQARAYSGTHVLAVVTRTGFCTAKGDLISSILYPKPVNFKFYKDAAKFVAFLTVLAALGTAYSIFTLIRNKVPVKQIITRALDIVTVVVPPALPAAMTVGTIYAQSRLKQHGIFCISPPRINLSGKVRLVCFDKTGTLTEDGLDIWGVVPQGESGFLPLVHELQSLAGGPLHSCLATCHAVSLLGGQPVGDPVDLRMLESTGWTQKEAEGAAAEAQVAQLFHSRALAVMSPPGPGELLSSTKERLGDATPLAILRRFPFSSSLQRMSVLVKRPGVGPAEAYMKGAPEMVASLCRRESVPADFSQTLHHFTSDGFRVLGLAYKAVAAIGTFEEAQCVTRDSVENEMAFLGLLVMKNVLKPETAPVIHLLRNAEIRTVMVTGDNMLTAVNVAKSSRMVEAREQVVFVNAIPPSHGKPAALRFIPSDQPPEASYQHETCFPEEPLCHLALNGKSFAVVCEHFPDLLPKILIQATVFARMLPDQKTLLVQSFQNLNYCVAMCGDGANDCGALKTADVGISLSEAEASVASPFTSRTANIECVPIIIREGRCSLVTSFGIFKYMALYSIVQFVSVLLLYTINTNLGDLQFLFFDLIITTTVAALMGRTAPAKDLGPRRPQGALLSVVVLGSLLLQTALLITVQVIGYFITVAQPWYVPLNSTVTAPQNLPNYENTVVFCVSGFQYLTLAVVLSKGYPFRKPLYTNVVFLVALILLFGLMVWLTIYPLAFMKQWLQLKSIGDLSFKAILLGLATLHFFAAFVVETGLDHGGLSSLRALRHKKPPRKLFKQLEREMRQRPLPPWPPLNQAVFAKGKISIATR